MKLDTKRFGMIEVRDEDVLTFPAGLVGFSQMKRYIVVGYSERVAFLQSVENPDLAFPLVSAHTLGHDYPDVPIEPIAAQAGLDGKLEELAVAVVLSAPRGQPATVNLVAPIIVNLVTHLGAQVFLEGSRFGTRELFATPAPTIQAAPSEQQLGG